MKRDDLAVGDRVHLQTETAQGQLREYWGVVQATDQRGIRVAWDDGAIAVLAYDGATADDARRLEKV